MTSFSSQQIAIGHRYGDGHSRMNGPYVDNRCDTFWDPVNARISPCYENFVAAFPVIIAICILLGHVIRLLISYRPAWSRPFVQEPNVAKENGESRSVDPDFKILGLFLFSLSGFMLQAMRIFLLDFRLQLILPALAWAVTGLLVLTLRPKTTSTSLLVLYFAILIHKLTVTADFRLPLDGDDVVVVAQLIMLACAITVLVQMPMRDPRLPHSEIAPAFTAPTSQLRTPEDNMTLWQFLTVAWMAPLISVGKKRQLEDEDVWRLGFEFQHRALHDNFRELRGSVMQRLIRANLLDIVILSGLSAVEVLANFAVPVLLQQLLRSMEDPLAPVSAAVTYAALSCVVRLISAQSGVLSLWFGRRCYERSRGEMITMLYEKILSRKIVGARQNSDENGLEKQDEAASAGKILNLMRNDVYEVSQRFWEVQSLVTKPLGLIVSIVLIWQLIGWPCLGGIVTVLIAQVLNAVFARLLLRWERIRRRATDTRLQRVSQFVEAIRHLRWYGWEGSWCEQIMTARQKELNLRIVTGLWNILISFTNSFASGMFPVAAFYAYSGLAGFPLRIYIAFPALQLFTMLETNLRELPNLITVLLNARVAAGRIQDFMNEPDRDEVEGSYMDDQEPDSEVAGKAFELRHASFAWPGHQEPVLYDITLKFPKGLTVIYGEVASGKTALLQAMLGELERTAGDVVRPKIMIGYCAQSPWLQSMSIRENILFSEPYHDKRYKETLEACALITDMAKFKHGDLSNIGENGIGLSGGQRARVALARAVYSRAKILMLDDPISALDHQTAEFIVQKCLKGPLMEDRTVILVTHRTELCRDAEQFVHMSKGRARVQHHSLLNTHNEEGPVSSNQDRVIADGKADEDTTLAAVPDKFIEDEHRVHGSVQAAIYWEYIKAGKLRWWSVLLVAMALFRLISVGQTWFLKQWGEAYGSVSELIFAFNSRLVVFGFFDDFPSPEYDISPWLIGFALIAVAKALALLMGQCLMLIIVYLAGKQMFKQVMDRVSGATFRFYDVTPVGRLMNRLTSDIGTIDGNISAQFLQAAGLVIAWVISVVVIASVTPVFLIFSLLLTLAFVLIYLRFLPTSQSLRRLEMVSLSPLISNFGTLLNGLVTVRAFAVQRRFQDRVIAVTDTFQKMDHFYWSLQAWLMYRFDLLSACSTLILTLLAILTGVSPGLTAFVLDSAYQFVRSTHTLCKVYGQLQMDFVSVERVVELLHLDQEFKGPEPPAWWPVGDIVFDKVTVRYAPHLDPSLSDLSFRIKAGSKVAVVGRTGSGKSTLAMALLATVLPESGSICIDGFDIAKVDPLPLRRRITFLAQDPVLFPGSMHQNLDPLEEHSVDECAAVLEKICGKHQWTLDTNVDTGGRNLSQGQRQLIGLARCLLRRSPIIILDEATASIDMETAMHIQEILNEEMKESTIITIAHRLEAVKNADYCLVLDSGRILKQGSAKDLLES